MTKLNISNNNIKQGESLPLRVLRVSWPCPACQVDKRRAAKGAHGPVGWQLAAAPLGCAPERLRGLGSGGARGHMETRGDAGFGG